jgi:predicted nucleotidyltransferase
MIFGFRFNNLVVETGIIRLTLPQDKLYINDFRIFESMDKEINKIIIRYINLLRKKYTDFEGVYVFGSYARGNATRDSDIDLALIFRELDDSKRFDIQVQLMLLASQIDTRIEPHPISLDAFYSGNPFAAEIKKTGFKIMEESA